MKTRKISMIKTNLLNIIKSVMPSIVNSVLIKKYGVIYHRKGGTDNNGLFVSGRRHQIVTTGFGLVTWQQQKYNWRDYTKMIVKEINNRF